MESLVQSYIQPFCEKKGYKWKDQATVEWILENWNINIKKDESDRKFDFAIFNGKDVFLFETNFYGSGGTKLKSVSGEFSELYEFLKNQGIKLYRITDGAGRKSAKNPLTEAFKTMEGNIYNIKNLKEGILEELTK